MLVLGIDEAGRGPVIGSMFIAGVLMDKKKDKELVSIGVKDSKLLTPKKREELRGKIEQMAEEIHYVEVSAREIDDKRSVMSLNELEALKIAELVEMFKKVPDQVIIDTPDPTGLGFVNRIKKYTRLPGEVIAEHKADVNYPTVSAASIIAKTARDDSVRKIEGKAGVPLGTGYPHDPLVIKFLEKCEGKYPVFVRKSWYTARRLKHKREQKTLTEF